ncbi:hypothetical protein GCM10011390_39630 [Aureimonas endophytica]|jgi:hypothetical protein|uniref:Uncharacterized protein n=1 Tax=Aureimonas endophytica TaxID=2027858 RepID=A0A916ZX54_9HYPH|nr:MULTISPECIES: hypothetical protein [Aureimonas]GGE16631.1 hypothetical protein GCM10011390_39630 [Aureimonas endophytica]
MEKTIEKVAAAYALSAHDDVHANGRTYVNDRFSSVEEFVQFEFDGDASDEADKLAARFGVSREEARQALEAAIADVDLGYVNAAWREEWLDTTASEMAGRDAEEWVSACYDEEGFDPSNAAYCEDETYQPELRAALAEAGFLSELTPADAALYEDTFQARVNVLVAQRDREAVEAAVGSMASEHVERLYALMFEEVGDEAPGAGKRLNEFVLAGIFHEVIEAALEAR